MALDVAVQQLQELFQI